MDIIISKSNGIYTIKSDKLDIIEKYVMYSKKQALQHFRIKNNLKYKHLNIIEL